MTKTRHGTSAESSTPIDDRSMTDANPAFDTVHPSGHILVRSCRGGYMHSVTLSEGAMETDAETLAEESCGPQTSPASRPCWKYAMRSSRPGIRRPPAFRPTKISTRRLRNYWRTNCAVAGADPLQHPGLGGLGTRDDIGGRFDGIGAEQFSCVGQ